MIIDRTPIRADDPFVVHCGYCGRPMRICMQYDRVDCGRQARKREDAPPVADELPSGRRDRPAL